MTKFDFIIKICIVVTLTKDSEKIIGRLPSGYGHGPRALRVSKLLQVTT